MRVIEGLARGVRLDAPAGASVRPVLDRVKLAWFSCLRGRVEGSGVLDLYAGTGSLGIEALSRGAPSCTFVERSAECLESLRRNLEKTRLRGLAEVEALDVPEALERLRSRGEEFDLVFLDPPFDVAEEGGFYGPGGVLGLSGSVLSRGGLACLRRRAEKKPRRARRPAAKSAESIAGLRLLDVRRWGRSEVLFLRSGTDGSSDA